MAGTVLENLSNRKLSVLMFVLTVVESVFFLIGLCIAPQPSGVENILGTVCKDEPGAHNDTSIWMWSRGRGRCEMLELNHNQGWQPVGSERRDTKEENLWQANKLVFVFQMPLPRDGRIRDYSRWQQNILGVLQPNVVYNANYNQDERPMMTIDARIAVRDRQDDDDEWTLYRRGLEERELDCVRSDIIDEELYACTPLALFEIGSMHYDYYLLNIRLPVDTERQMNLHIGNVADLNLAIIYSNGGFTQVWLALKSVFTVMAFASTWWFWKRVHQEDRKPVLMEQMLFYLAVSLVVLDFPCEYLTIYFDLPFMVLLNDIRMGIFYAALFSFWLVFAGEHMLIKTKEATEDRATARKYWPQLTAVGSTCLMLLIFDVAERGGQLYNPFYSIWYTTGWSVLAYVFIVAAAIAAVVYLVFFACMLWRVFRTIRFKRTVMSTLPQARQLHYKGIIYRFQFLAVVTLGCSALTVFGFVIGQSTEGLWKWSEYFDVELTSGFFTGVYGMWNTYICGLLYLYAPSHKKKETAGEANILSVDDMDTTPRPHYEPDMEFANLVHKVSFD